VIRWFLFFSFALGAFDVVSYVLSDPDTGRIISDPIWLNDAVVCFSRTIAYIAWALPIFYLFWPSIVSKKRREQMLAETLNKRTYNGQTIPSGLVSGYYDYDTYDNGRSSLHNQSVSKARF
jgi:hypothetical protein